MKDSNRVLRHAVFFAFKDMASEQDIRRVTDAFAELPKKINTIIDYQWGPNTSTRNADGFTHCFFVTFADEAGRDVYLPHPAHSREFVSVLAPHMKDVFVIDYWGKHPEQEITNELKHAVFLKFRDDATGADVKKIEDAFAELPSRISAIKAFEWGRNNSPESHDDGFTHCFMLSFESEKGLAEYRPHPAHQALAKLLPPVIEKIRILDFAP